MVQDGYLSEEEGLEEEESGKINTFLSSLAAACDTCATYLFT